MSVLLLGLVGLVGTGVFLGCCVFSGPQYQGARSDHFDGERFINQLPVDHGSFGDMMKFLTTRDRGAWQSWTDAAPGAPPPDQVESGQLRVTFVNHATVLLQLDGVNILTDPIWSERASPVSFAGPQRVRPPGIRFADLPRIDAVIISHNHYDHLDMPTLERLDQAHKPLFIVGLGNGPLLSDAGIERVHELDWWQQTTLLGGLEVVSVPAQHFSSRGLCDRDTTLWTGYVLLGRGGPVYFAGDTGWGPHFAQIRRRFGPMRLAVLPIGAYLPAWFMHPIHISPAEAVRAHEVMQAKTSLAIHFGTFELSDDGQHQPPADLKTHLAQRGLSTTDFWVLEFGEGRPVPALGPGPAQ